VSALSPFPVYNTMSDERPHKAHNPSQSGKKAEKKATGKKRLNISNDTVYRPVVCFSHPHARFRRLHPAQVDEQKGRVAAQQRRIKLAFMFLS
jgi:hypothetical protein